MLAQWRTSFPARKHILKNINKSDHVISSYPHLQLEHGYQRALCTVLAPVKAAKGFKPTIPLAQDEVFLLVSSREQALTELRSQPSAAPKIAIIGLDLPDVTGECIVVYKSLEYSCSEIARGIDIVVKLRAVLGLPYPAAAKLVWLFIERFFYGLTPIGSSYMAINKLIGYLEREQ